MAPTQARTLFPELSTRELDEMPFPDWIADVCTDGLWFCEADSQDFVIANHLFEQVIDPIAVLAELSRVLRPGGRMVLSASDKHHSEERLRPPIDFSTLAEIHGSDRRERVPEDYMDIVRYIHPELLAHPEPELQHHLQRFMDRREHMHVWTSDLFREFLQRSMQMLGLRFQKVLEISGDQTFIEYFIVLEKVQTDGEKS